MARIEAAIAERARQQLGLITHQQLTDIGCTRRMLQRRLEQGGLVRAGKRVVRIAGVPTSWEQAVLAASLDAGGDALASHMSAAALWGFAGIRPGAVEVSVPTPHQPRPARGRVHRVSDLHADDARTRAPFRLTSPERTLVDIAARLRRDHLETVLDHAARVELLTDRSVHDTLTRLRRQGRPGVRKLEQVLGLHATQPRADSWLEHKLLQLLREAGLPAPQTQVHLHRGEGRVARVDALYERARLVVEVDGHRTHSTRRDRQADAQREAALVASGWRVVRFTYEDVTQRPAYVVATIRLLLGVA